MTWASVPLADVAEIVSGATPRTGEERFWGGDILWTTPKDISDLDTAYLDRPPRTITEEGLKSCAASLLPAESVLLSSRAPIGLVAINRQPVATNQGFKSLVPDRKRLDSKFLYYWLRSRTSYLQGLGNGATFKEISKAVVERIEIPLPPLDEQLRIAAILDEADALRRKCKRALELLETLTQSIFLEMFGDEQNAVRLAEVCSRITDGTHQAPNWADQGIPFLFVSNVRNQNISFETTKFVSLEEYGRLTKSAPIEAGDVLYTAVGSYGNAAVVTGAERFAFQRHIAHIKPIADRIDSTFLSHALESPALKLQADKTARGIAQKTVTLESLKQFLIPLPKRQHQEIFVERVGRTRRLVSAMLTMKLELEDIFVSLQHRAFSGQL